MTERAKEAEKGKAGPSRHLQLGRRAEDLAADYVRRLGWTILTRNFSCKLGELDIVALDEGGKELVVVEVRYRTFGDMQSPADSVGPKKLRALVGAGRVWVESRNWTGPWRIDLVGITASPRDPEERWRLEHIPDITGGNFLF
ncbi:MAG: YraN family protein [Synergistaceae bacterium]|jgi:putative endonuclease|nr:YraN family protein [Synergistaceae bacterium]